jgi:hypothetical protein
MKIINVYILLIIVLFSCRNENERQNAVARVFDNYLYEEDISDKFPNNLSKSDSILYRNNLVNNWATEHLLLQKARVNVEDENNEINNLVETYRRELLIDKYKQAVLLQELDTIITENDLDNYYQKNKNIYKLNEDLIQLRYIHFSVDLKDKKEVIKMFKSNSKDNMDTLIDRELEFFSFNFNDSIWISYRLAELKLPVLKNENRVKKDQYIQKEDSLGVYLVAVKDILLRNDIAPKSYVLPTIKQMILHRRKLELMKKIEQTLVNDAINNKQFEQY